MKNLKTQYFSTFGFAKYDNHRTSFISDEPACNFLEFQLKTSQIYETISSYTEDCPRNLHGRPACNVLSSEKRKSTHTKAVDERFLYL